MNEQVCDKLFALVIGTVFAVWLMNDVIYTATVSEDLNHSAANACGYTPDDYGGLIICKFAVEHTGRNAIGE